MYCINTLHLSRVLISNFKFCTEDVSFQFGAVIYKQRNGVTMGSPLAPILAELYLSNFENKNIFIDISLKEFCLL